jgi:hypothetical protein
MVSPDNKTNCQNITEILMKKEEKLEDTNGIVRSEKWKKDGQFNCQKKKDIMTNNDLQNNAQKTKDRVTRTPLKPGCDRRCS